MFNSQSRIRVISLFFINERLFPPMKSLWLLDGVSVGNHEKFTTEVYPGDLIIWQCPENSGIAAVTGINDFNTNIFADYPQPVPGHENTYMATITMNPGKDILNNDWPYHIEADGTSFDPKIRVVPSPTSSLNPIDVTAAKANLSVTTA